MFHIFLNFAKYLSVLLCTCTPLRSGEETKTTTISINQQIQENIVLVPLRDMLNKIIDPNTDRHTKLELKGEILGNLKVILEDGIQTEHKVKQLLKRVGNLEMEKNYADRFRLLLGLTDRIDCVESILAPGTNFQGVQRSKRWSTIFGLRTPAIEKFKKKVEDAGMTTVTFAKCIEWLYDECNTRVYDDIPLLSKIINERTIEGALAIMQITNDEFIVQAVKIIVAPVKGLDLTPTTTPKS